MRTFAGADYEVRRENTAKYWKEPRYTGDVVSLDCNYCNFRVLKRSTGMPRRSKSGLGRYNRMRGKMVRHLHAEHRDKMLELMDSDTRKTEPLMWI